MNIVIIKGRLTAEPEIRTTQSGTTVCKFTIAVDRDYKNADGTKTCDFIPVTVWRNTAEFVSKYFKKGDMVLIQGALYTDKYTDKDGNNRISYFVQGDKIEFGTTKSKQETP